MFCPKCGTQSAENSPFCGSCGNNLSSLSPASAAAHPAQAAAVVQPMPAASLGSAHADNQMMSFATAIATCFAKYVDFDGRASRAEFWWFYLFTTLIGWLALLVDNSGVVSAILNLAFLLPVLAAGARRLHDTGKSGWWQLLILTIIGVIPLIVLWALPSSKETNNYGDPV